MNPKEHHAALHDYMTQYDLALRKTYDELYELNVTEDAYRIIYHVPDKYVTPPDEGILSAAVADVAGRMVHPDDRQSFLSFFDLDGVRRSLALQDSVTGEFRKLRTSGEYKWASLTLIPFSGDDSGDEILLCFIMDIDGKKKTQEIEYQNLCLRRQQQDAERYRIIVSARRPSCWNGIQIPGPVFTRPRSGASPLPPG